MGGTGCTVSGAVGAFVAETVCDFIKPGAIDIDRIYQENQHLSEEVVKDLFLQKATTFESDSHLTEKISKIYAALIPAVAGMNVGVAAATGANAIDHNALPSMLWGAYIIGTVGYIGYQVHKSWYEDGAEAALKTLGIEIVQEIVLIGTSVAAIKGAATVYRIAGTTKTFVKLEGALAYVYEATPGLKTMVVTVHDKLLAFGLALEGTTAGKACAKVGEAAERMVEGAAGGVKRMFGGKEVEVASSKLPVKRSEFMKERIHQTEAELAQGTTKAGAPYKKSYVDAQVKGAIEEAAGEATMLRAGYVKLDSKLPGNKGFDGVYVKYEKPGVPSDIIIVESKYAKLGDAKMAVTGKGTQMSEEWVLAKIDAMQRIEDPAIKAMGKLLNDHKPLIRRRVNVIDAQGHNSWTKVDLPHAPRLGE